MKAVVPEHIGIILDGNRRFARRLMKEPWRGHEWGAKKVESLIRWSSELGIRNLTLYSFSTKNFNRPRREFETLMKLFEREFRRVVDHPDIHKNRIRIRVIGRKELLPESVQEAIRAAEEATKDYDGMVVNFAIAYGGRKEIVDATKNIMRLMEEGEISSEDVNEGLFNKSTYLGESPEPDLIIRTGGERRLSDFLLWAGAYSELVFLDTAWPEFSKKDFVSSIKEFQSRQRRFGK